MPCGAGARLECDQSTAELCGSGGLEQEMNADIAGEILDWAFGRWLRTISLNLHEGKCPFFRRPIDTLSYCWD